MLPNNMRLNMDVKFPFDDYFAYLQCDSDSDRTAFRAKFLRDVRDKVKEVATRGYIVPNQTVDCVLMFIPNEQIYRFIHEEDSAIIDEALHRKVILCSPLTLFVVLAVVREAVQNFTIEQSSQEILQVLVEFEHQWEMFKSQMDEIGERLEKAQAVYMNLRTTRQNQLEKPLRRIRELKELQAHSGNNTAPAERLL
jgi:DNA recombination protein RmuC